MNRVFFLKITAVIIMFIFIFGSMGVALGKGSGGRGGGGRSTSSIKSVSNPKSTTSKAGVGTASSGFGSRIKSWFNQKTSAATRLHSGPATATNNAYYSNGRYNGWTGIFWGYLLGRALSPHSTAVNANGVANDGKYELNGNKQYEWDEPTVGDNIIAYGVLVLVVVLIFLIGRLVYRRIKRMNVLNRS